MNKTGYNIRVINEKMGEFINETFSKAVCIVGFKKTRIGYKSNYSTLSDPVTSPTNSANVGIKQISLQGRF